MNERWKYQIKTGLPFGIIMPVVMTSIEWFGTSATFTEAFISKKFLIYLIVFLVVGVFLIGYSNWREKRKNNEYKSEIKNP